MSNTKETWTRTHDLALIYLALAYGTDQTLSDEEVDSLKLALADWYEDISEAEVNEVVMEAMAIHLEDDDHREVTRAMHSLKTNLSERARRRALEQAMHIAEADGVLLASERSLILKLAEVWDVKSIGLRLLEFTTATVEELPEWSLMHDVALVFIVMAHSTDNKLHDTEVTAMVERLQSWQPELSEEEVRRVLRKALRFYSTGPDQEALSRSLAAIQANLSLFQRLGLLNDLIYIAESDGRVTEQEKEMFESFSRSLGTEAPVGGAANT